MRAVRNWGGFFVIRDSDRADRPAR